MKASEIEVVSCEPNRANRLDWFTVSGPVGRQEYMIAGFSLAVLKFVCEFVAVWLGTGQYFSPLDFVNPWLSSKAPFLIDAPAAGLAWLLFTIPFVWIAIAMSVRRAADIGITPWFGLVMLVPLANLAAMCLLAIIPTDLLKVDVQQSTDEERVRQETINAFRPTIDNASAANLQRTTTLGTAIVAIALGCATQTIVGMFSVWVLQVYGFILFFSAPVVAGAVAGFAYNRHERNSFWAMTLVILVMNFFSFSLMLMVGLDGAICLIMAFPLLGPLSLAGGLIGASIATAGLRPGIDERRGMIGSMILLPVCLALEPLDNQAPLHHVTTSVDISAPPNLVWQNVIAFPEIDAPLDWHFRLGIAAPMHATIDGHGVGAVRHCEFTTGAFVEPITAWEPPSKLAFDVQSQPHPMHEWTPFSHLHPPHLDSGFISRRGGFRLEALGGGGTRLHGTTWYELDVRPRLYWQCWADPVIHSIHRRVLEHIAIQSESLNRGE